ncbi:hypothetical protein D893_02681 [Thioalkalivibrio sp. ALE21]|uniref:hypothetical protein n=1 Tax=Thioalkalivibrio sp. ALE21 TaxID=1158175 RepID=UPI000D9D754E|nr:hypothetical protein [Thioalkalivibrio sp. ALE21]PYF99432.1 hypothetical protein D893_02681 [Thioalkalivibrio sp. ALE21]
MHFEQDFIGEHRDVFERIVARAHKVAVVIFVITFLAYGVAAWMAFNEQPWVALILATLAYLFFRQFRLVSLGLARTGLRGETGTAEPLKALDLALEEDGAHAVLSEVENHLRAIDEDEPGDPGEESAGPSRRGATGETGEGPRGGDRDGS